MWQSYTGRRQVFHPHLRDQWHKTRWSAVRNKWWNSKLPSLSAVGVNRLHELNVSRILTPPTQRRSFWRALHRPKRLSFARRYSRSNGAAIRDVATSTALPPPAPSFKPKIDLACFSRFHLFRRPLFTTLQLSATTNADNPYSTNPGAALDPRINRADLHRISIDKYKPQYCTMMKLRELRHPPPPRARRDIGAVEREAGCSEKKHPFGRYHPRQAFASVDPSINVKHHRISTCPGI